MVRIDFIWEGIDPNNPEDMCDNRQAVIESEYIPRVGEEVYLNDVGALEQVSGTVERVIWNYYVGESPDGQGYWGVVIDLSHIQIIEKSD